ncbi:glycoside hydrolase, partial [Arthrobacter sp. SO3]|uniref:glycoside hydrolase n=1 Tax=Arthrobacter sp. SO3 TaxID=1897057 RepID=UPI001CFFE7BC
MTWTGSGRKTAALCAAVVFLGALALPAHADPLPTVFQVPASPEIPSPEDIAAAKTSESATAEQVTAIDRLLADASTAQEASLAASLQANNSYGEALVELQSRRDTAAVAAAKASAAGAEEQRMRKQIGQLAGDLYRNGGLNPALSSFVSGNGNPLEQAATLEAVTAGRTRAFQSAETAAVAAESLTAAAEDANRAADEAARTAETRKLDAERANDAERKAVSEASAQRTVLVDQLATLKNTTVALESARVDALDRQRQQDRLAAVTAAAAQGPGQGAARQPDAGNPTPGNPAPVNQSPQAPAAPAPVPPPAPVAPVPGPAAPAPAQPA